MPSQGSAPVYEAKARALDEDADRVRAKGYERAAELLEMAADTYRRMARIERQDADAEVKQ